MAIAKLSYHSHLVPVPPAGALPAASVQLDHFLWICYKSNWDLQASKALTGFPPCCGYILGLNRTVLAQGLLDITNSWQWDKVRALPDHAETDQHGLFLSLGMGLAESCCYSYPGAALGAPCLPLINTVLWILAIWRFWIGLTGYLCSALLVDHKIVLMSAQFCLTTGLTNTWLVKITVG